MYCKHCGTGLEDNARFCASCGAQRQSAVPGAPVNQTYQSSCAPVSAAAPPRRKKRSVIVILAAVLVILADFQFMSLSIVGKTATASVTSARQDRQSYGESTPDPRRFRIDYTFFVDGESYSGSGAMIFKHGVRSGQTIRVRYLPYYPAINAPADNTKVLGGLLMSGLGVFVLVLGVRGKGRMEFRWFGRTKERSVLNDDRRR